MKIKRRTSVIAKVLPDRTGLSPLVFTATLHIYDPSLHTKHSDGISEPEPSYSPAWTQSLGRILEGLFGFGTGEGEGIAR